LPSTAGFVRVYFAAYAVQGINMRFLSVAIIWLIAAAGHIAAAGAVGLSQNEALDIASSQVLPANRTSPSAQSHHPIPGGRSSQEFRLDVILAIATVTNQMALDRLGKGISLLDSNPDHQTPEEENVRAWSTRVDAANQINGMEMGRRTNRSDQARAVGQDSMYFGRNSNQLYDDGAEDVIGKLLDYWH
jgi:hypothetical protein